MAKIGAVKTSERGNTIWLRIIAVLLLIAAFQLASGWIYREVKHLPALTKGHDQIWGLKFFDFVAPAIWAVLNAVAGVSLLQNKKLALPAAALGLALTAVISFRTFAFYGMRGFFGISEIVNIIVGIGICAYLMHMTTKGVLK